MFRSGRRRGVTKDGVDWGKGMAIFLSIYCNEKKDIMKIFNALMKTKRNRPRSIFKILSFFWFYACPYMNL